MKHKNMTYPESIEFLAKQAGLNPENGMIRDANYIEKNYSSLKYLMNETNIFFQTQLAKSNVAKKYLDRRLIKDSII